MLGGGQMGKEPNKPVMSVRKVTKLYNAIVETLKDEEVRGVNYYICSNPNPHITITKDSVAGTTSFIISCPICKCGAKGNFYKKPDNILSKELPTHEWYRPTLKETLKLRSKNPQLLEHILMGGLELREIQ